MEGHLHEIEDSFMLLHLVLNNLKAQKLDIKWVDYGSNCHCKEIIPYEASITTQYNTNNTHIVTLLAVLTTHKKKMLLTIIIMYNSNKTHITFLFCYFFIYLIKQKLKL